MEWVIPALALLFVGAVTVFIVAVLQSRSSGGNKTQKQTGQGTANRPDTNDLRFGTLSQGGSPLHVPSNWSPPSPAENIREEGRGEGPAGDDSGAASVQPGPITMPPGIPPQPSLIPPTEPLSSPAAPVMPPPPVLPVIPVIPVMPLSPTPPADVAPVSPVDVPAFFPPPPPEEAAAPLGVRTGVPVAERDEDATVYDKGREYPVEAAEANEGDLPTISAIPPYFEVLSGQYETVGRRILLFTQGGGATFFFRRAPDRQERFPPNFILLRSVQVSRDPNAHGEFVYERKNGVDRCIVRNFGTYERKSNPLFIQGRMLNYGEEVELAQGDVLAIGDVQLRFYPRANAATPPPADGPPLL